MLIRDLDCLTLDELCIEIGEVLWQQALDTARSVYARPTKDRNTALLKMRSAQTLTEQYAVRLVDQWLESDRKPA